jgi:putative nucleotidyltransferase with HDIG domain
VLLKAKILVVDDESGIRELCTRILRQNYEITTAPDGPTAIAMAETAPPDLLLTDIRMPGMTGLEAAKRIVSRNPEISVVVMTGFGEFDTLLETVRIGVSGFLVKPFTPDDLRKTVEESLHKGLYFKKNTRLRSLTPLLDLHGGRLADADHNQVLQTLVETVRRELEANVSLVCMDDDGHNVVVTASATGNAAPVVMITSQADQNSPISANGETGATDNGLPTPKVDAEGKVLTVPLQASGQVLAVLTASRDEVPFTTGDRDVLRLICAQAAIAIENVRLFKRLKRSYWKTVYALAATVDLRDHPTAGHSDRLAHYALSIGRRLNLSETQMEDLKIAALLHDIGKIGIGDGILLKPGDLTSEEYDWMKTHTLMGARILAMADFSPRVVEAVLFHHERFDGTGYPLGLSKDQIPIEARILTAADAFESMTSTRSYRTAMPVDEAVAELERGRATQFDPHIVDALLACLETGEAAPTAAETDPMQVDRAQALSA